MNAPLGPRVHEACVDGLRVRLIPLPHLRTATLGLFVGVGSRHEQAETNGISHVLEHMLFRGTERYPTSYALHHAIESLGGTLEASTHPDYTHYELTVPRLSLGDALARFAEVFEPPTFPGLDLEREVLLEELREDLDEDGNLIDPDDLARLLVFGDHPLGMPVAGHAENVERFDAAGLGAWFGRHYVRENCVLVVAGALGSDQEGLGAPGVLGLIETAFAHLPGGTPSEAKPFEAPRTFEPGTMYRFVEDEGSQTQARLAFHAPGLSHPDQMALQLLGRVLDDGLSARVFRRVTEERGLAYDAYAAVEAYAECGVIDFGGSVAHEKVPALLREFHGLTAALRDTLVPPDELDKARRRFVWDLDMMLDDDASVADFYGTNALFGLPDTFESTLAEAAAVTSEDLLRLSRDVFRAGAEHVLCVGEDKAGDRAIRRAAFPGVAK